MKGYFSISHDPYTEQIQFGKLSEDLGDLGTLRDSLREGSRISMLIAHDVIEHSVSHRTKTYITYEEEMRAVGAIEFVRGSDGFDLHSELYNQTELCYRDVKPVPYIIGKFLLENSYVSTEMMRYLIEKGITPSNARNATYQFAWGRMQKEQQFQNEYSARNAFSFIEHNIDSVLNAILEEDSWGASVYFDTEKHIFRTQHKRQH